MKPFTRIPNPRELRRKLDINQMDFWSQIGVTQSGGSRYESGRSMPKPVRELLRLVFEVAWSPSITRYSPYYGPQGAAQSWSTELTLSQPLRWGLMAFAGIGRFDAPQLRDAAYTYGSIGISRDLGHWHGELSYIHASGEADRIYLLGPAGGPLAATIAWHF